MFGPLIFRRQKHLATLKKITEVPLSVDTYFPEVAEACLAAGVDILNDIKGLDQPGMMAVVKKYPAAGLIIMHSRPRTALPLAADLTNFYREKITELEQAGIDLRRVCFDPGVGFGKSINDNLDLIQTPEKFRYEDFPLLYGVSRKRIIGTLTGEKVANKRDPGSIAASLWLLEKNVEIVRVHDVSGMQQANHVFETLHR